MNLMNQFAPRTVVLAGILVAVSIGPLAAQDDGRQSRPPAGDQARQPPQPAGGSDSATSRVLKILEAKAIAELGKDEYQRQLKLVRDLFKQQFETERQPLLAMRATLGDFKFEMPTWYIGTADGQAIAWIAIYDSGAEMLGYTEFGKWNSATKFQEQLAAVALAQMEKAATSEIRAAGQVAVDKQREKSKSPRTWRSANGQFSVVARFVSKTADQVKLEKEDGTIIDVNVTQLSQKDREFLDSLPADQNSPGQKKSGGD